MTVQERQKEVMKIKSDLHDFLKEKGLDSFDCMHVKRSLAKLRELDRERNIYYNDKWKGYEGYSIHGKNNVFETYEEAREALVNKLIEIYENNIQEKSRSI